MFQNITNELESNELTTFDFILRYGLFEIDMKKVADIITVFDAEYSLITKWKFMDGKLKLIEKEKRKDIILAEEEALYSISYTSKSH